MPKISQAAEKRLPLKHQIESNLRMVSIWEGDLLGTLHTCWLRIQCQNVTWARKISDIETSSYKDY